MKHIILLTGLLMLLVQVSAQGKFAGSKKDLIGKKYTDSKAIPGLEGWEFRSGSVITPYDDPEMITADVLQKGKTWIVYFGFMEDTATREYVIADVIEIKNLIAPWQIKTGLCRQGGIENMEIVAVVKDVRNQEFLKPAKQAWRFNRDKRRVELLSVKGIDCMNEGLE